MHADSCPTMLLACCFESVFAIKLKPQIFSCVVCNLKLVTYFFTQIFLKDIRKINVQTPIIVFECKGHFMQIAIWVSEKSSTMLTLI